MPTWCHNRPIEPQRHTWDETAGLVVIGDRGEMRGETRGSGPGSSPGCEPPPAFARRTPRRCGSRSGGRGILGGALDAPSACRSIATPHTSDDSRNHDDSARPEHPDHPRHAGRTRGRSLPCTNALHARFERVHHLARIRVRRDHGALFERSLDHAREVKKKVGHARDAGRRLQTDRQSPLQELVVVRTRTSDTSSIS